MGPAAQDPPAAQGHSAAQSLEARSERPKGHEHSAALQARSAYNLQLLEQPHHQSSSTID